MTCKAVEYRAELIDDLNRLMRVGGEPNTGTEAQLLDAFDMLSGIVAEWTDGGDDMGEACTCGEHHRPRKDGLVTFKEIYEAHRAKWLLDKPINEQTRDELHTPQPFNPNRDPKEYRAN